MRNETGLPPDIAKQRSEARQEPPPRRLVNDVEEPPPKEAEVEEEETDLENCPSRHCSAKLDKEWMFCARCGADLVQKNFAKKLDIDFSEDDVQDYLFKGYVMKTIKVFGKNSALMKTSQPKDLGDIDDFIMNGKWAKNDDGSDRNVTDFYFRQMNTLALAAVSVLKVNGEDIGTTVAEKVDWLNSRGSFFIDKLTLKVQLYNKAITEHLEKGDTLSGS
jgi:hypothetical protein